MVYSVAILKRQLASALGPRSIGPPCDSDRFEAQSLKNRVQLITYVDRLAGNLKQLRALLKGPLADIFGGVHLAPFFTPIDGADAGFDPIDHTDVDLRLGAVFSLAILTCFLVSMIAGIRIAVFLLPFSGLFMSVIYPTMNSKGISCFRKPEHGAVAGVILFFTCVAAVVGPLVMGAISDAFGDPKYGFILATGFAGLLFIGLLLNWIVSPTRQLLQKLDRTEYHVPETQDLRLQAQR